MTILNKKNNKTILFFIFILILGIGINKYFSKEDSNSFDAPISGLGLFVFTEDNPQMHNQILDSSILNNYKYKFMNKTGKDLECNLNIFVNGIQINIQDIENDSLSNNFKFFLKNNESKVLPIKPILDNLKNGLNIVNLNIITDNNTNAIDVNEKVWLKSTYNYTLEINNNGNELKKDDFILKQAKNYISIENLPNENQFIINNTKEDLEKEIAPKNFIKAKKGSNVSLPIILGGGNSTELLLYGTLNNNQIIINNSLNLYYNLKENKYTIDNIEIKAPEKEGKYEMVFYGVFNLEKTNFNDINSIETRASHRITLIVE
ncbi:TPA: hypothetical protein I9081_002480 [Clostridium perfringens]|jgi:hypothetical protein|uniref:hypothetical protein n=1 Tax=Clostridium perfringens TaxID=1502 RepID=UPI00115BB569|nr:hypothetical protein [Clostridium perfringens]EHA6442205.1 hypothetical protein [Clostridium perfringens]EJT5915550.1 hypothetical protein [Clostridium perfringens]EJT5926358.1 hypothetical protein [Clostridium perfringens]MDH5087705.1 hypothetical protein [Clostridium perfringens]UBK67509.1 hypothetical protein KLF46_13830 [Clostridium perfringens]